MPLIRARSRFRLRFSDFDEMKHFPKTDSRSPCPVTFQRHFIDFNSEARPFRH